MLNQLIVIAVPVAVALTLIGQIVIDVANAKMRQNPRD